MAGALELGGAGEFLDAMDAVDRQLLDMAGGSKVAVRPTASAPDGDGVPPRWVSMGVDHFGRVGAQTEGVLALDRSACNDPA